MKIQGSLIRNVISGVAVCSCIGGGLFIGSAHAAPSADQMRQWLDRQAGVFVLVGYDDSALALDLAGRKDDLVHMLPGNPEKVNALREAIRAKHLYGRLTVGHWQDKALPFADNLLSVLAVRDMTAITRQGMPVQEILRVVRPHGIAVLGGIDSSRRNTILPELKAGGSDFEVLPTDDGTLAIRKTWPEGLDHWTHFHYDAGRTMVSRDSRFGTPCGYQWVFGPTWPVNGPKHSNSNRMILSAGGRIFYVTSNVPLNELERPRRKSGSVIPYYLVARDAFNGMMLWHRSLVEYDKQLGVDRGPLKALPIPKGQRAPVVNGVELENGVTAEDRARIGQDTDYATRLGHSMVTDGAFLYGVFGDRIASIDARTGEVAKVFSKKAAGDGRLACEDGLLVVSGLTGTLQVFDAATAALKWEDRRGNPLVKDGRMYYTVKGQELVCADLHSGKELWKQVALGEHLLLVKSEIVMTCGPANRFSAFSVKDGKRLWSFENKDYTRAAYYMKDLIWFKDVLRQGADGSWPKQRQLSGIDPLTGTLEKSVTFNFSHSGGVCRGGIDIATESHVISSRPVNFIEPAKDSTFELREGRHACALGLRVANGLLYTPPQGCLCNSTNLRGFVAIGKIEDPGKDAAHPLVKGEGHGVDDQRSAVNDSQSEWPMFRHDIERSAGTANQVPRDFQLLWKVSMVEGRLGSGPLEDEWTIKLSGDSRLTDPVVAGGLVVAADTDRHQVIGADAHTGAVRWRFAADGRVAVSPTLYRNSCLFGGRDGWVYCLSARDGSLLWRLRAAPRETRVLAYGQLESPWPVVGGVLVSGDTAYVLAGRSHTIGGGCWFHAIDVSTGRIKQTLRHNGPNPQDKKPAGEYPLILISDGKTVTTAERWLKTNDPKAPANVASGLYYATRDVFDRSWHRRSFSIRSSAVKAREDWANHVKIQGAKGTLVAGDRASKQGYAYNLVHIKPVGNEKALTQEREPWLAGYKDEKQTWKVSIPIPLQYEAMTLTKDLLLVAGPRDLFDREGKGVVQARSLEDGSVVHEMEMDAIPAAEGLAVAYGKLYVTTRDGTLYCFGKK